MTADARHPPDGLGPAGRHLWRAVLEDYAPTPSEVVVLIAACQAADRVAQAKAAIDAEGIVIEGRYGSRAHPAVAIERDSRIAMLRCLRELGLEPSTAPNSHRGSSSFPRGAR